MTGRTRPITTTGVAPKRDPLVLVKRITELTEQLQAAQAERDELQRERDRLRAELNRAIDVATSAECDRDEATRKRLQVKRERDALREALSDLLSRDDDSTRRRIIAKRLVPVDHQAYADPIDGGYQGYEGACHDCDWRSGTVHPSSAEGKSKAQDDAQSHWAALRASTPSEGDE